MQDQASRSETRRFSEREVRGERGHHAAMCPIVHEIRGSRIPALSSIPAHVGLAGDHRGLVLRQNFQAFPNQFVE